MKKSILERGVVALLFVLVLVVFSFAERDTKKVFSQYGKSPDPAFSQLHTVNSPTAQITLRPTQQ